MLRIAAEVLSLMLAYVFWHVPREGVDHTAYGTALMSFHAALAVAPPSGFVRSFSTRVSRLPWLDAAMAYEDWYIIVDSAGLDSFDAAAVDAARRSVHDAAAVAASTGAGGLYRLLGGEAIVPSETTWFGKPDGTTYVDFASALETWRQSCATLWQRQMVLGPAPQYTAQTTTSGPERGIASIRIVDEKLRAIDASQES
jgi:hypothetical protein